VRFLADESCDYRIVQALRASGHDVSAIVERERGAPDRHVFERARREERILLTEDKDFGQLAVASGLSSTAGVVLIRCTEEARAGLAHEIVDLAETWGERLQGSIAVWTPRRVRLRRIEREAD
jgi:predicted nuclease of predicted toxin-antitoxin system